MRIDGVPNIRACMEPCRDGVEIAGQNSYPAPDFDVLEVVDWLFPKGMNHHTLMTGSSILNAVANKVVRQLSGLGELPAKSAHPVPLATREQPDVLVIGAGPAGLAAATQAALAGARTVLIDEQLQAGGNLCSDPRFGTHDARARAARAVDAGVDIRLSTTAVGYYGEGSEPVLVVASPDRLTLMAPKRYVYATGGYAMNRLFINNDRPGVVAARAAGRLLVSHGVQPGRRVCLISDAGDTYADVLAIAMRDAGCHVTRALEPQTRIVGVHGRAWVSAVELSMGANTPAPERRRIECDLVAVSATPAPASEAPRQHGCDVAFRNDGGGFAVIVDECGRTNIDNVFACGDVCGFMGPEAATTHGARVGREVVADIDLNKAGNAHTTEGA